MKFSKYFPYFIILILTCWLFAKGCNSAPQFSEPRIVFKDRIIKLTQQSDSTKAIANKQDTVRTKLIVKWRTKTKDSVVYKPCEELILICDSIIVVDSSQIASLRQVIKIDSSIIATQKIMLHSDSLDIKCLQKSIRKHKRQKVLIAGSLGVLLGLAVIR